MTSDQFIFDYDNIELGDAGSIDVLEPVDQDSSILIEGWSLYLVRDEFFLPEYIVVMFDEEIISKVPLNAMRPDVTEAKKLDDKYALCGFSVKIPFEQRFTEKNKFSFYSGYNGHYKTILKPGYKELQLELTGRCNMKCPQCPSVSYSDFHNKDMNMDDLKIIKTLLENSELICLDGFGEIFMNKDFVEFLRATPRSNQIIFHTNGMLFSSKYWDAILECSPPLRNMIFSVDSLVPHKYENLRPGGKLDKVLDNMFKFKEYRESNNRNLPKIIVNMTLMKDNVDELCDYVELASRLDGYFEINQLYDAQQLNSNIEVTKEEKQFRFNYEEQKPKHYAREVNSSIKKAVALAKEKGVTVMFSGSNLEMLNEGASGDEYGGFREPVECCPHIRNHQMIFADGRAQFCVWQTSPVFNWKETNNVDILKDPRGIIIREMILKGEIPYECSGAGCKWVGLELSTEKKDDIEQVKGGWSGKAK
ncbi:MAG: radical SAM protein [Deferribacterales bacterium]